MTNDNQNADDVPGLSEEETLEALEELHHDGDVEVVAGLGENLDEPSFRLTDSGEDRATSVLQEKDEAVLYIVQMHLSRVGKIKDPDAVTKALVELGKVLRDDAGVNVFRVLERNQQEDWPLQIDFEGLPEDFVEVFDADAE